MQEVKPTPWMPEGWARTVDYVFYDDRACGFVLGDLKTIKSDTIADRAGKPKPSTACISMRIGYALHKLTAPLGAQVTTNGSLT
jgi:hypothetical protein